MTAALAHSLVEALRARGWTITTAESCTGGLVAAAITDVAGSSAVFERSIVAYSNETKTGWLDVPSNLLAEHGAVSEPVAAAMAQGALRHGADVAISITGIAGPGGGTAEKPVGMVCFGVATARGVVAHTVRFTDEGRAAIRGAATSHALQTALDAVHAETRSP